VSERAALGRGERVHLRRPTSRDAAEFVERVRASRELHARWVSPPDTRADFAAYVRRARGDELEALLVCRNEDGAIAGVYNLSQIFRGPLRGAYLGYYAFEPFAGGGLMAEGLRLVVRHAFGELHLHRLEANVQPENVRSTKLVRDFGFRLEGHSPRYLKLGGRWRDHQRWAISPEILPGMPAIAIARSGPVTLREVSSANWREVMDVTPAREQRRWVGPIGDLLALCRYEGTWNPLAIDVGGSIVGFLLWGRDPDDLGYRLRNVVVDRAQQGKGYGRAAIEAAIAMLRSKPGREPIALAYPPDDDVAAHLARSLGFTETGERVGREVVATLAAPGRKT
jgi:[ribosomal protein S5]-alanine N-acetyltransferase